MNNAEWIVKDRRALHQIPEVGLDLPRTTEYCVAVLRGMGLDPRPAGPGLVVDLGTSGPLFAWRADMDALPVQEEASVPFASTVPGHMHACGHDAHMAAALGLARHYTAGGETLPCRLRLILQPGEEGWDGAARMIEAGALDGVEAIAGLHVGCIFPELPKGCFGTRKGTVMAASVFFDLTFKGKGTHGAYPHLGLDALQAACQFVSGLQTVRYGAASPVHPTVITIGSIHAGSAANVLPGEAAVSGSFRTTTQEDLAAMGAGLERHARAIADAHRVEVALASHMAAPITANSDHALADLLAEAVADTQGPDRWQWIADPSLGGEDFGAFLQKVPGVFFFLGTNPEGCDAPHHHPKFMVDDGELARIVPVAAALIRKWAAGR